MKFIKSNEKTWEEKQGYSKRVYLTEDDLGISGALFQEIRIKPGETAKEHYHKLQTEIFYFLNTNGYWIINGAKHKPTKGEILVIEPNDKHEIVNDSKEDYLYLAFKYNYSKEDSFED